MYKILLNLFLLQNIYAFNFSQSVCNGVGEIKYKNAIYTGGCKNNKKEGRGRIIFNDSQKYEGQWHNDKKNGFGTQYYKNGVIYSGEWRDGVYDGVGTLKYSSKEKYEGSWKMGKKNGHGVYTYPNGAIYDGLWKDDAKNGYGVFRYANGIVYKGEFVNNIKEGSGEIYYKSGDKYKGSFKQNLHNGYGVYRFAKGGSYKGEWLNGKREGHGVYMYASGAIYDGEWVADKKEGKGRYTDSQGNIYTGSFKANKKDGYGNLVYKVGGSYDGFWKDDKYEGKGVLTYADGRVYNGNWHNGQKDGLGAEYSQYGVCKGVWKKDEMVSITEEYKYSDAYKHLNDIRLSVGMIELKPNSILQKAAQNHSNYILLHHDGMKGLDYHYEKEGLDGFSGIKAKDRAVKAGYFSTYIGEGISNFCSAQQSINSLMSAIYHRFEILSFTKDEIGVGFTQDSKSLKRNFVHNTGNSNLNVLCQHDDRWIGDYYEDVCADKKLKIKVDPYNEAKEKLMIKNPRYVIWPVDGSVDNLYYFQDEVPNPMPDFIKTGNPISIEFNPYYFPKTIVVYSFRLYDAKGEVTKTRLLTKNTDPNKEFKRTQYALFPLEPLKRDTQYKVVIKYKYNGSSKHISSSFKTMK